MLNFFPTATANRSLFNRFLKIGFTILFVSITFVTFGQLTTDESPTPQEIIQSFFDSGLLISNVEFNGAPEQMGSFDCQNCGIGLTDGFLITNGSVENAEGPNDVPSASHSASDDSFYDEDLLTIYPDIELDINDVTTIEFDFVAAGDSILFDYVFASEEYHEFVDSNGTTVSDPFGVFVSGPGIDGEFSNGAKNIALIPGTDDYVQIDNLNNGENNTGPCVNCEYLITNLAAPDDPESVQYDAYSTVLTASIGELQAGETYHMKIAIADVNDQSYDTGIFFGKQTLHSNKKFVSFNDGEEVIEESNPIPVCQTIYIEFVRFSPINLADTIPLEWSSWGGEAYIIEEPLPEEIIIPAGEVTVERSIQFFENNYSNNDGSIEELIAWSYPASFPSTYLTWDARATMKILDSIFIPTLPENIIFEDTVHLCNNEGFEIQSEGIENYWFFIDWYIQGQSTGSLGFLNSLLVSPNQTTTYILEADHKCSDLTVADTITLELPVNLNVELSVDSNTFFSQEGSALLQWLDCGKDFAEITQETSAQFSPEQPGSYALKITKDSCQFITDCFPFPVVSVEEMPGLEGISIHPNPTKNKVTIEYSGQTRLSRYELLDYAGRKVNEGVFSKSLMITVTLDGESGIYFLRIFSEDGESLTRKLVKQ